MEPEAEEPPDRVWRDWVLAGLVASATLLEVLVRDGIVWSPLALAFGLTLALTMLWRRTRPLATVALAFGALVVVDLLSVFVAGQPFSLYAGAAVLVLVYSLFRWGSTRAAAIGVVIVLVEVVVIAATDFTGLIDLAGGLLVLLFPAALGASIRYRRLVHVQRFDRFRSQEREMLARELHDTVAHHVSAIAIQAQAGRFLATSDNLGGAAAALEVIEKEASRTLAEMRSVVGSLRRNDPGARELAQRGVPDIEALATAEGAHGIRIEVEQCGDLEQLRQPVQSALYRVVQESVTNAQRHARQANRVHVLISGEGRSVRLCISDDGEPSPSTPGPPGYGLAGMAERVMMLGGTLQAGPGPERGWVVEATIPRNGGTS